MDERGSGLSARERRSLDRVIHADGYVGKTPFDGACHRYLHEEGKDVFLVTARDAPSPAFPRFTLVDRREFATSAATGGAVVYDRVFRPGQPTSRWRESLEKSLSSAANSRPHYVGEVGASGSAPGSFSRERQEEDAFGAWSPHAVYSGSAFYEDPEGVRELVVVCQAFSGEEALAQIAAAMKPRATGRLLSGVLLHDPQTKSVNVGWSVHVRHLRGGIAHWAGLVGLALR